MNKNYLIVTSILEGKHFPSRQGCDIVVEASFDGEVLTTDPVPHTCHPNFNTELAWGVDRRGLHVHRLHRTPVKLQCFAVERSSRKKERVGYVVLEIRGIQDGVRSAKWLSLLNSKYHGSKPEIHVGLHLEEDTVPDAPAGASSEPARAEFKAHRVVAQQPADRGTETDLEDLTPRLNLKDGCYEIGRDTTVLYLFTVTISFAANLSHLQGSSCEKPSAGRGGRYHFVYHLLGHEVTTEAFSSLENPQFPAERASLHIRSCGPALRQFFAAHPTLQVLLSTDNDVIGATEIPLGDFSASSPKFSVSVQGLFQLHPIPHNEALVSSIAAEYRPIVGVHVEIAEKPQAVGGAEDQTDSRRNESVPEHHPAPPPPPQSFPIREESPRPAPRSRSREVRPRTPTRLAPERSPTRQPRKQLDFSPPQKLGRAENQRPATNTTAAVPSSLAAHPRTLQSCSGIGPPETTAKGKLPKVIDLTDDEDEDQFHHFSLMLDIRSLEVLSTRGKEMQCYIRYHYPFFGGNTPFQSHKWTTVVPNRLATVLGGFNTYNFAATYKMVKMAFQELPLMVEIFCRGEGSDRLFGTAEVSLGSVLRCPASTLVKDNGATGQRRMQTSKVSIMHTKGIVGELQGVVCLDDLGITSLPSKEPPGSLGGASSRPRLVQAAAEAQEQEILRIMTELELWKEQQEIMFRTRLKEKEDAHLRALSEDWKRQDMERDAVLRRKLKENKELEEKLKSRLKDIESREQAQARREAEFEQQKSDIQLQKTRLQKEAKETIKRSLEEHEHMFNIEKKRVMELETELKKLRRQVSELEAKLKDREKLLEALQTSQRDAFSQEMKVHMDFEKVLDEKAALLKELHEALRQRELYRERCDLAESQLLSCKEHLRQAQQRDFEARRDEVECLYQKAKARFENDPAPITTTAGSHPKSPSDDGTAFETPEKTSPQHSAPTMQTTSESTGHSPLRALSSATGKQGPSLPVAEEHSPPGASASSSSWMEHMRRLIEERDMLLSSGLYRKDDVIIVKLNQHIADTVRKHV